MNASGSALKFFELYNRHDIDAMVGLFADNGSIDYSPAKLSGSARREGRAIWQELIAAFPDFHNSVSSVIEGSDGLSAVVEVSFSGTQQRDSLGIRNEGKHFNDLKHVFIFRFDKNGLIESVRAYWDNAQLFRELGKVSL